MRVALIGNLNTIKKIRSMMDAEALFMEVVDYPCDWTQVVPVLEEVQKTFDAVLFTGVRYFVHASRCLSPTIPWGFTKRSVNSVLCTLLKAQLAGVDISKITFDLHIITTRQMTDLLCNKVGIPVKDVRLYRYNDTAHYQAYLTSVDQASTYNSTACEFHLDNLKNGQATLCLSASDGVVEHPSMKGQPAFLIPLTEEDVNAALNELRIQHIQLEYQRKDGFVPTVFALALQMENAYNGSVQELRQMYTIHQVEMEVFSYAQSSGAALEKRSNTEFLLYTTQEELYSATENLTKFELAQQLQYLPDVACVSMGIGFGRTYNMAKNNAQISCRSALTQKSSCYYIMDEQQDQHGPFVLGQLQQMRETTDIQLEQIANETGLSVSVLTALIKAQAQYGFQTITSEKLAKMCGRTPNSMNRIVSKLLQARYAEIVGVQPQDGAGRPKRLLRLKLPVV